MIMIKNNLLLLELSGPKSCNIEIDQNSFALKFEITDPDGERRADEVNVQSHNAYSTISTTLFTNEGVQLEFFLNSPAPQGGNNGPHMFFTFDSAVELQVTVDGHDMSHVLSPSGDNFLFVEHVMQDGHLTFSYDLSHTHLLGTQADI